MDESDQESENNDGRSHKESHVRSKSPSRKRFPSLHTTLASIPQRVSSEKKRSSMLSSPWHLSTAAVHGVGHVAKKVVNNRLTESLWHSRKGTHVPSDTSIDHTSKPPSNVADEQTVSSKPTHEEEKISPTFENSKSLDGSHGKLVDESENLKSSNVSTTGSKVIDQPDNLEHPDVNTKVIDQPKKSKPSDDSHVRLLDDHNSQSTSISNAHDQLDNLKTPETTSSVIDPPENSKPPDGAPVNQHRWPSAYSKQSEDPKPPNGRLVNQHRWPGSKVMDQLGISRHSDGSHVRLFHQHRWPNVIHPSKSSDGSHVKQHPSPASRGVSLTPSNKDRAGSYTSANRGVSLTPITKRLDHPLSSYNGEVASSESDAIKEVDDSLTTRGPSTTTTEVGHSPTARVRGTNPLPHARHPITSSSSRESCNSNTNLISSEIDSSPAKETILSSTGISPTPSPSNGEISPTDTARGVSPNPGPRTRGVSPTPTRHSSSRQFFNSHLFSIFGKITHSKKEKILTNHKENAKHLELLQNIQVQWQFVNARAEATMELQRVNAQKSLYEMWSAVLQLRDSIAAKKIDIDLLILQLKLYAILYRQMTYVDEWASIQKDHEYALSVTINNLQVKSLRLPIIEGVKADIKDLKLVVESSIQVMQTALSSIQSTLSKLEKTHFMASQLANIAFHERALLDECEIFLASAAPLQVKECSLRSHLIQLNRNHGSE